MTTALRREALPASHVWWRIAHSSWNDPLDPDFGKPSLPLPDRPRGDQVIVFER